MNKEQMTAWEKVCIARDPKRPTAKFYIEQIMDDFYELHGDRAFRDDAAVIGGIGVLDGIPVTVIGQEKGGDIREKIDRNFGCAHPEGYRKSLRLMKQAEKFARPVICIVDTQGAFCGVGAEERGMGEAIARNLMEISCLKTPVISVLIGEGGSGGALALAVSDRIAMLENSVYSILSPEGFASILWKDSARAAEAAGLMRMVADDVKALGLIDDVLPEPEGGAQQAPEKAAQTMRRYLIKTLRQLRQQDMDTLLLQRYERIRAFGTDAVSEEEPKKNGRE